MKTKIVLPVIVTLFAGASFAADTNPKGGGGAGVKEAIEFANDHGTNLGQGKKSLGIKGIGEFVSAENHRTNQLDGEGEPPISAP